MMLAGLLSSVLLVGLDMAAFPGLLKNAITGLEQIDFTSSLMNVVLGVLLFVSARKINLSLLDRQHRIVLALALLSTFLNTVLIGFVLQLCLGLVGVEIPLLHALLFGALISPTDPIATIAILKEIGLPKKLEVLVEGESLLNDGVAAVAFSVLAGIAVTGSEPAVLEIGVELVREVGGGLIIGILAGGIGAHADKEIKTIAQIFTVSLAIIFFGGFVCRSLHVSYPLAMVVAGIVYNVVSSNVEGQKDRKSDLNVWHPIEAVLVSILFFTIGLLALYPSEDTNFVALTLIIPLALVCRIISVAIPIGVRGLGKSTFNAEILLSSLLTWGGLKGGITIALAFLLPPISSKALFVDLAYACVAFSVLIQAPTIRLFFPNSALKRIVKII